jgi:hypothetical protein
MMVRHPISRNVAFHFDLRSILNADLGESLVRGMPGVGFSCEISRNDRMESLRSRDLFFYSLHEYYNIGIL